MGEEKKNNEVPMEFDDEMPIEEPEMGND